MLDTKTDGESLIITGTSIDDLSISKNEVTITGAWTSAAYNTNNKTKVKISGEVTLNSKVDCYSIEFLSGGHLTINGGARLRIWEGGIVNNDCESVNYLKLIVDKTNVAEFLSKNPCKLMCTTVFTNYGYKETTSKSLCLCHIQTNISSATSEGSINCLKFDFTNNKWVNFNGRIEMCQYGTFKTWMLSKPYNDGDRTLSFNNGILEIKENVQIPIQFDSGKNCLIGNSFSGKIKLIDLINTIQQQFPRDTIYFIYNFSTQSWTQFSKSSLPKTYLNPMDEFIFWHDITGSVLTLNYKNLVWDPSFEEEVQAPLLTTMSAPMMTTSSPSANDELPMPAAPSMIDGEGMIFED